MKTSSAKQKGRKHQQWTRDQIYKCFPHLEAGDVESRAMGSGGEDIMLSPLARKSFPFSVECKSYKSFAVYNVMEQAKENCPKGAEPLAIIKGDRQQPLAVLNAEYFFKIIKARSNAKKWRTK